MRDRTATGDSTGTTASTPQTEMLLEFSDIDLKVTDIMTESIISVGSHETVELAIQEMAKYKISCIIVTDGGRAVGILTERDVLQGVATRYGDFVGARIAKEMSHPVISVAPDTTALAASQTMTSKNIKRLLVVNEQQPVGVITQTDITSALISMSPFKNIADLMTHGVVAVDELATMAEAAERMAVHSISCVVVLRGSNAVGIVTEKDIVQRVALSHGDPNEIYVTEIMSFPVMTVPPTHSVMSASRMMDQMGIHRLIVGSPEDVRGIVTQTDIIAAVRRKLKKARQARLQQQSEMGQLAKSAMTDLSSVHCLLREIPCFQESVAEAVKIAESPGNAPFHHSAIPECDQDEAARRDNILKKLETHLSNAQDTLARLAGMPEVPISGKSVPS